jgi:hypothetical protein
LEHEVVKCVRFLIGLAVLLSACAQSAEPRPSVNVPAAAVETRTPSGSAAPADAASATPFTAEAGAAAPSPLPPGAVATPPEATAGTTPLPGTTPFPTPGPTITPGSTRVFGTVVRADGTPARDVCVVLEKGICPIGTDDGGHWFVDVPAGPINWNFIYKVAGREVGRQSLAGSGGGELRLPRFVLPGS